MKLFKSNIHVEGQLLSDFLRDMVVTNRVDEENMITFENKFDNRNGIQY